MWNRWQLKENAKFVLRAAYWKAFLVSLIWTLTLGMGRDVFTFNFNTNDFDGLSRSFNAFLSVPIMTMLAGTLLSVSIISILISIFVFGPLEVGVQHYFLESTQMRFNLGSIFHGFATGRYRNVVTAMFLRNIYQFLWTLLLIIPGIVKSYSYSMLPYLLSENPGIPPSRALEMSMAITDGHKWQMFFLDLSFIGWYLLGAIAFGVGVLFVNPYYHTTQAQLYVALRTIALDRGILSLAELETY